MTRALALIVLAGCTDLSYDPEPVDPSTPVAIDMLRVDGQPGIVATGGTQAVAIASVASIGWSGEATDGFAVEPFDVDGWPNTHKPEYWVRALVAGTGSFVIRTNLGLAAGSIESADVATVAIVPHGYQLAGGGAFALDGTRLDVRAALLDPRGRGLVDATLVLADAGVPGTPRGWDGLTLGATIGAHAIDVTADSIGDRRFSIEVRAGYDRIESVRVGDRTCRHAYAGDVEIVTQHAVAAAPIAGAENCTFAAP
jgi:hypothetical protein